MGSYLAHGPEIYPKAHKNPRAFSCISGSIYLEFFYPMPLRGRIASPLLLNPHALWTQSHFGSSCLCSWSWTWKSDVVSRGLELLISFSSKCPCNIKISHKNIKNSFLLSKLTLYNFIHKSKDLLTKFLKMQTMWVN